MNTSITNQSAARDAGQKFVGLYKDSILNKISLLKHDGTTAMGEENLFSVTIPRGSLYNHGGAPRGTNAAWALKQIFHEIIASTPKIKRFVLAGKGAK